MQAHRTAAARFRARRLPVLAVALLSAAMVLVTALPAWAPQNPSYVIFSPYLWEGFTRVVDVRNWATNDGAPVQMWEARTSGDVTNQRWYRGSNGEFINVKANKCLDESAARDGATVYIYHCTGGRNQQWEFFGTIPYQYLRNRQDNRCLDIKDFGKSNGTPLQVWSCTGAWNQIFGSSQ